MKQLDAVVGRLLIQCLSPAFSRELASSNEFLFIRPGGIGDAVLLIPVIQAFKKKYPAASVTVLAEKRNAAIFTLCRPAVSNVFRYDVPKELLRAIRGDYGAVIDTEQWHRLSALSARLTRAPVSVGFATNERKKMFSHAIPYSHDDYEINSFLNLLTPFSGPLSIDLEKPFVFVPAEARNKTANRLQTIANKKIVAVFPGGSIREKQWPVKRLRDVARLIIRRGYGIAVVGGTEDAPLGEEITVGLDQSVNLCGRLSLAESAAVLAEVALLITGDSGIMHIASGLGIKIVALFGPGNVRKWAPRNKNTAIICKHPECSPCSKFGYTPPCKYDIACMKQISVQEVYSAAIKLLEGE